MTICLPSIMQSCAERQKKVRTAVDRQERIINFFVDKTNHVYRNQMF